MPDSLNILTGFPRLQIFYFLRTGLFLKSMTTQVNGSSTSSSDFPDGIPKRSFPTNRLIVLTHPPYYTPTIPNHSKSFFLASSGIAASLLDGGTMAQSRFKIPIDIHADSTCNIPAQSHLVELPVTKSRSRVDVGTRSGIWSANVLILIEQVI